MGGESISISSGEGDGERTVEKYDPDGEEAFGDAGPVVEEEALAVDADFGCKISRSWLPAGRCGAVDCGESRGVAGRDGIARLLLFAGDGCPRFEDSFAWR